MKFFNSVHVICFLASTVALAESSVETFGNEVIVQTASSVDGLALEAVTLSVKDDTLGQFIDYDFDSTALQVNIPSSATNTVVKHTFVVGKLSITWTSEQVDASEETEVIEYFHDIAPPTDPPTVKPTDPPTEPPTVKPTEPPTNVPTAEPPPPCAPYYHRESAVMTFAEAELAAPQGCVLAPVHATADIVPIAEAAGGANQCWTGIETSIPASGGSVNNWFNMVDGTPVPNTNDIWITGEPNNNPGGQTRATINKNGTQKLRDVKPTDTFTCAIYLCCGTSSDGTPTTPPPVASTPTPTAEPTSTPTVGTPTTPISGPTMPIGVKTIDNFVYKGAFRLKNGKFGGDDTTYSINYAVGTLAYDSGRNSLFIAGHAQSTRIAEYPLDVTPSFGSNVADLPETSEPLQDFVSPIDGVPNPEGLNRITGMLEVDGSLIVNMEDWYDGAADNKQTSVLLEDSSNVAGSYHNGLFEMSCRATGAGYMGKIPPEWQEAFGGAKYYTGWSSVGSITSRYSQGPSLFTWNPSNMIFGDASLSPQIPTQPFLYYPFFDQSAWLSPDANGSTDGPADPLWNTLSSGMYGFFVPNSSTFAVIGSNGGTASGIGYKIRGCGGYCSVDPDDNGNYYWLYDVNDILAAGNTWEPRPYAHGYWSIPHDDNGSHTIGGATFDYDNSRLYVSLRNAGQVGNYDRPPLIVVYDFN